MDALAELLEELGKKPSAPESPEEVYAQEREATALRRAFLASGPFAEEVAAGGGAGSGASSSSAPAGGPPGEGGGSAQPLSVAFSGGGVRAAAFDAGVLWRLAERGRLRDVEHLSLVSGSAYVGTALMTHLQDPLPPAPGQLDKRYLRAVYEMIDRMQHNAGFYARFSRRLFSRKGSWPPCQGILTLVAVTLFAVLLVPITHFMYVAYPMALLIDTEAGTHLRYSWCSDSTTHLLSYSGDRAWIVAGLLGAAAAAQAAARTVAARGGAPPRGGEEAASPRPKPPGGGLARIFMLEVRNVLLLFSALVCLLLVLVWFTFLVQWADHGRSTQDACGSFGFGSTAASLAVSTAQAVNHSSWHPSRCVDTLHEGLLQAVRLELAARAAVPTVGPTKPHPGLSVWRLWLIVNVGVAVAGLLGSQLRWDFLFLRTHHILALLSPLWALYILALVARRRVFAPLERLDFEDAWTVELAVVLGLAVILLPFYGPLRRIVHIYYRYSLQHAFYKDGKDVKLASTRARPLCPNLIISATLVDYCRLCDLDSGSVHFSEFFFTPACMGSERTGYIKTPEGLSASKAMAISGAASDAFLMTKMNRVWVRATFLALFNLFMGDYVTFSSLHRRGRAILQCQATVVHLVFVLFFVAMYAAQRLALEEQCRGFFWVFWVAWAVVGLLVSASFFAFHASCRWLLSSHLVRHIHTAVMHCHTSPQPPLQLYLNDGGLIECLGLISLLRRRCQWMLVTDATADFSMQLVCLRDSIQMAQSERICSFFDPEDPCRGVDPLLDDFRHSQAKYLRIGVLYDCWGQHGVADGAGGVAGRPPLKGEIFFVRMRLLDKALRVGHQRITQAEVEGGEAPSQPEEAAVARATSVPDMLQSELGGCCCDCCHASCNCGLLGRFPDISTGNQFLTPTQFALLCRLGYDLSGHALDDMARFQAEAAATAEAAAVPEAPVPAVGPEVARRRRHVTL